MDACYTAVEVLSLLLPKMFLPDETPQLRKLHNNSIVWQYLGHFDALYLARPSDCPSGSAIIFLGSRWMGAAESSSRTRGAADTYWEI